MRLQYVLCVTVITLVTDIVTGNQDKVVFQGQTNRPRGRKTTTLPPETKTLVASTTVHQPLSTRENTMKTPPTMTPIPYEEPDDLPQIPLEDIRRFNEIESIEEFLRIYGPPNKVLGSRIQGDEENIEERNNVETPKPAKCEPMSTTISLQNVTNNLFALYYPSCTRVLRCGGCCNTDLLSCQPTDIELRNFQVYVSEYKNGRLVGLTNKEVITVEEHIKCKCDCRIKKEHCNVFQEYNEKDCRCKCINHEDRQKCNSEEKSKIWDFDTCMCRCRETSECSTGFYYDDNSCTCKPEPLFYTRFGGNEEVQRRRPLNRYGYTTSNSRYKQRD